MSLLGGFKTNKAISVLLNSTNPGSQETKDAITRVKDAGAPAIPKLIDALGNTQPHSVIENLLLSMLSDKTLPAYVDGLVSDNKHIVASLLRILARSESYDANRLYDLFEDPDIPKNVLVQILIAQKHRLNASTLMAILGRVDKSIHQLIFKVINEVATEKIVPDLLRYANSNDPLIRIYVAMILGKFSLPEVRDALLKLLRDPNKKVRQSALESLGCMEIPVPAKPICQLLKDPDLTVQTKAIEAIIRLNDPNTIQYLIDILQDESEYVRRAAVEVLNEVGDARAIKDLLNALRDKDWWIRVRAADALGSIGGPRVVDAVLELIKDKDEFLRRTAVEILNSIKDERAFNHLVTALEDQDWWVRERAADALANMQDKRATEPLLKLLNREPETTEVAVKALAQIKDPRSIQPLIEKLNNCDDTLKKAIIDALSEIVDKEHKSQVEDAITRVMDHSNKSIREAATVAMNTMFARMEDRVSTKSIDADSSLATSIDSTSSASMLDVGATTKTMQPPAGVPEGVIDPQKLLPGQILAGRYRVIRKIGKGAFGVVVLVSDEMVNEKIVLKFLNPQMASDDSVIKRFVHELRYARRITHENVIRLFDFITFGQSCAISMEYFDSHSFAYELKSKKEHDHGRLLRIFSEICLGISAAHQVNVVHRDLKPANILVNDNEVVKVVDFGLAAAASQTDSRITKSGVLVGTPTYMAPEQVRGRKIDARTDIYSLGILMYEAFVGKPPYKGEDHMATLFQHVEGKAKAAYEMNDRVPKPLSDIIMRAMHVDPAKRYQSIDDLHTDILNYMD